ncbi:MFS transporter [Mycolicibacterium moriokaense]|uniref:MFS transporter n=1 Tax=Mycolicibacterium moriokaense TaxID=39691 RepID=A0AAD1HEC9_9MYCO|nr:MFS transporter [Mycolicibacterium moriokaense]MCV7038116.1 MFS transporter [Mycolicibacterium moriokaense]ORB19244.1 MFS transporter [Mycolicibacterium moriokaense]BBX03054.1 MFS transporter [Mycolicibacterium moriokaense]
MPTENDNPSTDRTLVAVAVLASFVAFLDGSVVNLALPAIGRDFAHQSLAGLALQQWVVDGYLLTLGALILVAGAISDQFGRLAVLRMGLAVFAVSSVLCAVAPTGWVLVAARCLQGIGAAFLVPSSLAMINARFSGAAQARAIGTWTAWTGTAFVVGPLLGGVLVDALNWRWIFAVNLVPLAITLYLTTRLPEGEFATADRPARVDVVGATLNAVGLTGVVYALIESQRLGFSHPAVVVGLAVGTACLIAFPLWEWRTPEPMMPLQIFAARNFAVGNASTVFLYAGVSLGMLVVGLFLQETAGLSATQAGLASLPVPVLSFLLARRFGMLAGAHGPRLFMAVGPLIAAVGYLLMAGAAEPFDFWTQMLPGLVIFGLGLTVTVSPLTAAILAAVEPAQSGVGSAVNNALSRIAGLIAIAFTGVIIGGAVDFDGFRQAMLVTAVLFVLAGVISAVGIRNQQYDVARVSAESTARCHDRATPPPAYTD